MKKSQRITLTVVAAMGMATAHGQAPGAPVDPNNCDEVRKAANAAGIPVPDNCKGRFGGNGAQHGGFGSTAKGHTGGG